MPPRLQLRAGVAQTLAFYPPEGVPDAAAHVSLYEQATLLPGSWPAAVPLSGAVVVTSAEQVASYDWLPGAPGALKAGRACLKLPTGQRYEVTVRGIDAVASRVYLDQPLAYDVPAGSELQSHRLALALSSSDTATPRRFCRAVWSYEVDGEPVVREQTFSVVHWPFQLDVSEEDIERHDHLFGELTNGDARWRKLIDGAHADVERALAALKATPDLVRDRDGLKDAVIFALLSKFYSGDAAKAKTWEARMTTALVQAMSANTWYDANDNQIAEEREQSGPPAGYVGVG